jgi:hypothetical protein
MGNKKSKMVDVNGPLSTASTEFIYVEYDFDKYFPVTMAYVMDFEN